MRVVLFSVCELGEGPVTIHKVAFLFEHARPRSLYCPVHDRRVVIPIAFTIADDASLGTAVGRKHAKYDQWLLRNPSASVARLVPPSTRCAAAAAAADRRRPTADRVGRWSLVFGRWSW